MSGDGVEDGEVDKLNNWIIREFDPTTIAVKNDEVESGGSGGRTDETDKILAKSKSIKKLSKAKNSAKIRCLK